MRVVFDANVLLAGLGTHGLCESLMLACLRTHTVVVSEYILEEVHEHYIGKFKATKSYAAVVMASLRSQCEVVLPVQVPADACRDPDDLPVLGTLAAGAADCLVTGDTDLLTLGAYAGKPIVSPRQFHAMLTKPT